MSTKRIFFIKKEEGSISLYDDGYMFIETIQNGIYQDLELGDTESRKLYSAMLKLYKNKEDRRMKSKDTEELFKSLGLPVYTKNQEYYRTIEMIENTLGNKCSKKEIMFMLYFLHDLQYNREDLKKMADIINKENKK